MPFKITDGWTRQEAEREVRKIQTKERKLRKLGGNGNYRQVEYKESFRCSYTLESRGYDNVLYAVWVTPLEEKD